MSSSYDNRGSSGRRRGGWGHWVPLVLTATVATVGIAAYFWNQRSEEHEENPEAEEAQHLDYENADYGDNPAYGATGNDSAPQMTGGNGGAPPSFRSDLRTDELGYGTTSDAPVRLQDNTIGGSGSNDNNTWGARVSGALRRTPSPQQVLNSAGKTVAAGVAAAGSVVGTALASIREEDKAAFQDHETWSAEAAKTEERPALQSRDTGSKKKRKAVAIVVSGDTKLDNIDEDGYHEHASILSHIPKHTDFSKVKLYVLVYAPTLKEKETAADQLSTAAPPSLSSSYSNIDHDQAQVSGEEKSPKISASTNPALNAVYTQAAALVEKESMALLFTSSNGHVHILRQLQPDVVYLQESLAGDEGSAVKQIQTWMRQDVILVVGAESGSGGLADSESEAEKPNKETKWWQKEERVGRGRGVVVVDSMRVHDDWSRRIQGEE